MTVIISGNHDNPERLTASGPLAREHGIVMAGTPKTVVPCGQYGENRITDSGPGYIHADIHGEAADLLLVPFPSEKRLGELYLHATEEEETKAGKLHTADASVVFRPRTAVPSRRHPPRCRPSFVMNSSGDGSERSVQLGGSYLLPGDIFPEQADYIALGHVHKPHRYLAGKMLFTAVLLFIIISGRSPLATKSSPSH